MFVGKVLDVVLPAGNKGVDVLLKRLVEVMVAVDPNVLLVLFMLIVGDNDGTMDVMFVLLEVIVGDKDGRLNKVSFEVGNGKADAVGPAVGPVIVILLIG